MVVRLSTNNMAEDYPQNTLALEEDAARTTEVQQWLGVHLKLSIEGRNVTVIGQTPIGVDLLKNYNKLVAPSLYIKTADMHLWFEEEAMLRFNKKRRRDADEEESDEDEEESDEDEQHAKRVCL